MLTEERIAEIEAMLGSADWMIAQASGTDESLVRELLAAYRESQAEVERLASDLEDCQNELRDTDAALAMANNHIDTKEREIERLLEYRKRLWSTLDRAVSNGNLCYCGLSEVCHYHKLLDDTKEPK